ncbi:lipopolysaccharide biosynthesis protein [Gordonia sp. (in: high G+C Gram-positive bacteria)]|jgi:O-antigen/teichoic acid export membrane protein|uniref:lipopolysaccharide biosynthesis protein n=1 Tax=Gordonia sp. (in: high G+C Gram-positive bacteria) TaxID=84139 RepID=UPI001D1F45C7|nr:polysaccharide biosynthesis protein [Gordonia sp. (in: high G+C Gram-positive bacteria)]MCB1296403.1 polysaccharide biosynthesis protein [Gordonia sp. (in: high G+C Gram-positive bacteria)]HMS77309.1 polysaccharide biosynthesis protein [Gordonia sp. (in: high G+C Gram-positive bacteria)]
MGRVTGATIVAAASGYLVLVLAARDLGATGYGVFAVFWAAYGMVTGTQNGQLQETARAVAGGDRNGGDRDGGRPVRVNAAIGLGLAAVVALSSPLWATHLFADDTWLSVGLLTAGVAGFAMYAHLSGVLSGSGRWPVFAALLCVDALIRLAAAVVATVAGWGLPAFLTITVLGTLSWIVIVCGSSSARDAMGLPGDAGDRALTVNTLTAMAAAAAAAVLVMGFPVLINLTRHHGDAADVRGAIILAVTLTRAPLLVPLNSFQGVLITRFVAARDHLARAVAVPVGAVAAIALVGAGLAWVIGPWLLTSVFGADFELSGAALAGFTVGAGSLGVLTVTGAATISADLHRWYAGGWWVATAASVLLLTVPAGQVTRVTLALVVGPLIGVAVHVAGQSPLRSGRSHVAGPGRDADAR